MKKDDKDSWTIARDNMLADNNEWNKTLNAIVDLKATDFVSEDGTDAKKYGLASPTVKISITRSKDKSRVTLNLGKAGDKVYAQRADKPTIYEVPKDILDKVQRPGSAYRNMQLAAFNRFDVTRVKLERGKDVVELLKDAGNWTLPTEPKVKLENAKVDSLLTSLQDIKIVKYTSGEPAVDALTIRLFEKKEKDKGETERVVLTFGKPKNKEVLAKRGGTPSAFTIKEEDFHKLDLRKEAFLAPPPALPPGMQKTEEKKADEKSKKS
jgi:hypothetical protein